jgi:hypothetical protein
MIALPLAGVILLGLLWSGFWFFAASQAAATIAAWREREASVGRIHKCSQQSIGGYPFHIEVSCANPSVDLRTTDPPLTLVARDGLVVSQVYDPTLLIGEFTGPLSLSETGGPQSMSANWSLAQVSLRGRPSAPERVSIVFEKPTLARLGRGTMEPAFRADRVELHARVAPGATDGNQALEVVVRTAAAISPIGPPLTMEPSNAEVQATVIGLKDVAPKPWNTRFHEIAASGGRIEVKQARFAQGDMLAVGSGTLKLTPAGRLDGQITLTVVGLDKLVAGLGVDQLVARYLAQRGGGGLDRIASSLDRVMPGLGGAVRNNSGTIAAAGINMLGKPAEIEGRKGVSLPLRFVDGAMYLGPIPLGQAPDAF